MKLSKHVEQERCQQRAVPSIIFDLAIFADEVRASGHAQHLYFSRKSIQRMRAEGVPKKDICLIEKKKHLRMVAKEDRVITVMYADQGKKRIQHYEH